MLSQSKPTMSKKKLRQTILAPFTMDFDEEDKSDSQWQSEEGRNAIG